MLGFPASEIFFDPQNEASGANLSFQNRTTKQAAIHQAARQISLALR
jgi:hypothetical protein